MKAHFGAGMSDLEVFRGSGREGERGREGVFDFLERNQPAGPSLSLDAFRLLLLLHRVYVMNPGKLIRDTVHDLYTIFFR